MSHTRQLVGLDFHKVGAKNESFTGKLKLSTQSSYFSSLLAMRYIISGETSEFFLASIFFSFEPVAMSITKPL